MVLDGIVQQMDCSWLLPVWIQPGAKQDCAVGIMDGCLKVRIAAPAVDNKANRSLTVFIAALLGLRRDQVQIVKGMTGRRKMLRIVAEAKPDWEKLFPRR
ncbi:hypothetical protein SAMN05660653_01246 [Desulfonatronum thiosulfatophilum]|uniref:UPF0235 protein SAMN05660653_01246 n=1 Tax=Desulfonatronum thiosulfatophilum TaxID=617002 RepID=A0A1G6BZU4_9BACT|nr:DUF167 domain-containing protein [Desulfonatronum thiosulfatophilum]SDB26134.1 hypothetical protein SAMN05660653_01246 [Desulfonatronum thiosulfatophilum]